LLLTAGADLLVVIVCEILGVTSFLVSLTSLVQAGHQLLVIPLFAVAILTYESVEIIVRYLI
jgi:hypothetical protein